MRDKSGMAVSSRRVLLAVGGGIAAYKACELARLLVKAGATVRAALTPSAQRFVSPMTFQALTGQPVAADLWDAQQEFTAGHIALADWAELAVVAPATADLLARLRAGLADEVATATLIAIDPSKWLLAPAMNERMWASPATQENVAALRSRGARFVGPAIGEMAERSHSGPGRLSEPAEILTAVDAALGGSRDLEGVPVLVTAGPTREHLDPVRFLSNPSTGRMGFAVAEAAQRRGARVTLIAGPTEVPPPAGVDLVRIVSAHELAQAVDSRADHVRVIVMSAAVADQRPSTVQPQKVKKRDGDESLTLVRTADILSGLGARQWNGAPRPVLVGFAAETENVEANALDKLQRKNLDLIVANDVSGAGAGFAADANRVLILEREGARSEVSGSKLQVADAIWDRVKPRL
jgi:phosphopantothenoylcysteine decarboxylase/phosphopantothenate--cysteine ligase